MCVYIELGMSTGVYTCTQGHVYGGILPVHMHHCWHTHVYTQACVWRTVHMCMVCGPASVQTHVWLFNMHIWGQSSLFHLIGSNLICGWIHHWRTPGDSPNTHVNHRAGALGFTSSEDLVRHQNSPKHTSFKLRPSGKKRPVPMKSARVVSWRS